MVLKDQKYKSSTKKQDEGVSYRKNTKSKNVLTQKENIKEILVDTTNVEETRVVLVDGGIVEDFEVETTTKTQNKGNVYLAKIIRVEPSLQAAFVEYGGSKHGFLPFTEIHPDYYHI